MRRGTLLLITASVLTLAVASVAWFARGAAAPPQTALATDVAAAAAGDAARAAVAADAREDVAAPTERTLVPEQVVAVVPPDVQEPPFLFEVDVEVVDEVGLPVAGQSVQFAPIGVDLHRSEHETDAAGRLSLRWHAHRPSMLAAIGLAQQPVFDVVQLDHGAPRRIALSVADASTAAAPPRIERAAVVLLHDPAVPNARPLEITLGGDGEPLIARQTPLHPFAWFGDRARLRQVEVASPSHASLISADVRASLIQALVSARLANNRQHIAIGRLLELSQQRNENVSPATDANFRAALLQLLAFQKERAAAAPLPPPPPPTRVLGLVRREDGTPAAEQRVAWKRGPDEPWQVATTDAEGRFEWSAEWNEEAPAKLLLRAGGGYHGLAERTCELVKATTTHIELVLLRGQVARGRAVDAAGAPLADRVVVWRSLDLRDDRRCLTGDDGAFELPNRTGPGRLWLLSEAGVPTCSSGAVYPDGSEVVLQEPARTGSIAVQPELPAGCASFDVRAFVWDAVSGLGQRVARNADGRLALTHLPAGSYRVVVHADVLGAIDLGAHWIDGNDCDLGRVGWPPPGDATFAPQDRRDRGAVEDLHRLGAEFDLRIDGFTAETTHLSLAPGTYRWSWRDGDDAAESRTFEVPSGGAVELRR